MLFDVCLCLLLLQLVNFLATNSSNSNSPAVALRFSRLSQADHETMVRTTVLELLQREAVRKCINAPVSSEVDGTGSLRTALVCAIVECHDEVIVRAILEAKADPSAVVALRCADDSYMSERTPLYYATRIGCDSEAVVRLLLEFGADAGIEMRDFGTNVMLLSEMHHKHQTIIRKHYKKTLVALLQTTTALTKDTAGVVVEFLTQPRHAVRQIITAARRNPGLKR